MAQEHDLAIKTDELPITTEAKVFYLTNCLRQFDYVKAQQENGIERPKIKLDLAYVIQSLLARQLKPASASGLMATDYPISFCTS